jgi:anti-anti-sigma factor
MNDELVRMRQERRNGSLVLFIRGEIDLSNVDQLQHEIDLAVVGCSHVVIDLSETEYIDSQGLRLLKQLSNRLSHEGKRLRLIAPPGSFARGVLEMTLISEGLDVIDTTAG